MDFEAVDTGKTVELRVKDYGAGIPEDVRDRIFEEGFSTSGSTGLGLFIIKKLVERYGGKLTCENDTDGAVFIVELPKG
ncbi:ATP-binding protein [Archaeoglobus sp.]